MSDLSTCIKTLKNLIVSKEFYKGVEFAKPYLQLYNDSTFLNEVGICYYYSEREGYAQKIWERALSISKTHNEYQNINENLNFCYAKHQLKYIHYPKTIVNNIKPKNTSPIITLTITTCKRLDLFQKTMNSFLNCCLDLNLIDAWICIDDNSSEEDRKKMKELYPFFTFILKDESSKGHARSLNILKDHVKSPYVFHLEDDWQFYVQKDYVSTLLKVLETEGPKCGQALINKNYIETIEQNTVGGISKKTYDNTYYLIHEFYQGEELNKNQHRGANCFYWPHYSLRPSITRKAIFDELGNYKETNCHFERDYAEKYIQKGYYSCFLDGVYTRHIGKLTYEKSSEHPNAYYLNNTSQFGAVIDNPLPPTETLPTPPPIQTPPRNSKIVENYVINLDRRSDRYESFQKTFGKYGFRRFSAVDGKEINYTANIGHIFANNDYNFRKGIVGCALSHIKLLTQLVNGEADCYVVFEDDTIPTKHFDHHFNNVLQVFLKSDIDFLFLGTYQRIEEKQDNMNLQINILDRKEWHSYSFGSASSYIVSKRGAQKFLEYLNTNSLTNAIDTEMLNTADDLTIGIVKPFLTTTTVGNNVNNYNDTDIQKEFNSITGVESYISLEIDYLQTNGYKMVEKVDEIKTKNFLFSDKKVKTNLLTSYHLRDRWVVITETDYQELLQNGFRLVRDSKFYI